VAYGRETYLGPSWKNGETVTRVCQWIFMAWQLISQEVSGKWAKECGIFNVFDGTNVLWNDSEEDVMVASSVVL
jgi:hypothetical protein